MDAIDVIDESYKEFLKMMSDVEGRGNAKSLSSVGAAYVTVFVNYLKGKIEDEKDLKSIHGEKTDD